MEPNASDREGSGERALLAGRLLRSFRRGKEGLRESERKETSLSAKAAAVKGECATAFLFPPPEKPVFLHFQRLDT